MKTLETLRKQIESTEHLHSVVKTMKILSLTSIRQYEEAVASLGDYYRTVEMGLQVVLRERPARIKAAASARDNRLGVLVFGSAQGLCGRFNEQVSTFAVERIEAMEPHSYTLMAVSELVVRYLEARSCEVAQVFTVPESTGAITATVQTLVVEVERWRSERDIDRVVLFYNKPRSGTFYDPHLHQLLPLDPDWLEALQERSWSSRTLPMFTMTWDRLFAALIRQYLFVSLYRAIAESLASEHASRLAAMQVAQENIEGRLRQLQGQFHRQRQSAITEELLDIMSGFEALTVEEHRSSE